MSAPSSVLMVARTSKRYSPDGSAWDQSPAGARTVPLIRGPFTQPPGRTSLTSNEESISWPGPSGAYSVIKYSVDTAVVCAPSIVGNNSAGTTHTQRLWHNN